MEVDFDKFGSGSGDNRPLPVPYYDFSFFDLHDLEGLVGARYEGATRVDQVEVVLLTG